MVIYLPLLISLIGLVIFLTRPPTSPDWKEVGRICFWVGLLAFLLEISHGGIAISTR